MRRRGAAAVRGSARVPSRAARLRADAACAMLGGGVWLKDESDRLGLPAFKVLGVVVGGRARAARGPGRARRSWPPARATTAARSRTSPRGAACARACSCRRARSPARREAIAGEGAEVVVVDGTYEDAVARAAEEGARAGRARARRRRRLRPGALGDRRLRDAVRRARRARSTRSSCPVGVGSLGAAAARYGAATGVRR